MAAYKTVTHAGTDLSHCMTNVLIDITMGLVLNYDANFPL